MQNTNAQGNLLSGSMEKRFNGFKTIYGCGGLLGHVTKTICINLANLS